MQLLLFYKRFSTCLLVLILILLGGGVVAQDNKETAAQMVEIGDEIFNQTLAVEEARELYTTAVAMDGENLRANYMAGVTSLMSVDKGAAKKYFLRVLELDPNYSFDILYKIGQAYHFDYDFEEAINFYSRYKQKLAGSGEVDATKYATAEEVERKLYECEQGQIMVEFPENVEIGNVGPEINSDKDDYAPVVNEAEDLLIFTSRRQNGNLNPDVAGDNYPFEDIFVTTKQDSVWVEAQNIGQPVNTLYHDSNVGLSKDGNSLYIYKDNNGGDIYLAEREPDGNWSEPQALGKPINTEYAETSVSLSPDGETMFFASNRKGTLGGLDIWITHKKKNGDWQDPENLGEEINTKYDEDGPFIGYDGKTLYFSSAGGEGMGGFDIYRVTYDSLSGSWDAPENMGYPINTPDHDIYFVPSKDGENAYYSSSRDDGYGGSDIYMLKIPKVLNHQEQVIDPSVTINVKVYNEDKNLIDASLQLVQEDGSDRLVARRKELGEYSIISGSTDTRLFTLSLTSKGYDSQSISLPIPSVGKESSVVEKEVIMVKSAPSVEKTPVAVKVAAAPTSKKLRNIYFDFNRDKVKAEYRDKIDKATAYLKANATAKLELVGHSDLIGAEKYNKGLSKNRAENVKKALVANGIAASRIQTRGEGSKYPLASNGQEKEGRELNRRVEFKVLR